MLVKVPTLQAKSQELSFDFGVSVDEILAEITANVRQRSFLDAGGDEDGLFSSVLG